MKNMNHTYNIYYDEEGDFLEVTFGEPTECYTEEIEEGVFIRKDKKTEGIKSIGILSFKRRAWLLQQLLQKIDVKLPIEINI